MALGALSVAPDRVHAAEPQTTAAAAKATNAPEKAPKPDTRSFIGAWAITDNLNNLFNVRLYPGGKAVSTVGTSGVASAGGTRLSASELRELGRWQSWGNGVRIDSSNGWTDWNYVGPEGLSHASWQPRQSGGVWRLDGSTVSINWISGWRTTMSLDPATPLRLRHWAPGADRNGPETGGVRQGKRID